MSINRYRGPLPKKVQLDLNVDKVTTVAGRLLVGQYQEGKILWSYSTVTSALERRALNLGWLKLSFLGG